MKLFEISQHIEALLNASVDPETGEIVEAALEELEALEEARGAKALAVAAYALGQEAEAEAIRATAKRLTARAAVHEKHAERLRQYIADHIVEGEKLSDDRVSISWRKSDAVVIDDETALPDPFWRYKREPAKDEIKRTIKSGIGVDGAHLETRMNVVLK
jgi:cell division septum initiation protein DivIVA